MELRSYQQECVDLVDQKQSGKYLICLATGLGKTVIFANFKRRGRTLILSHREELVYQPQKYYNCTFGVERANEHSNGEEVISASVQTLSKDNRLHRFKPDAFYTIIIDECHHAAAPSYKKILNYFTGAKLCIGVTATPRRGDKVRLSDVFDEIIYERDLRWGIKNHFLCAVRCEQITANYSLDKVKKTMGDYNTKELETQMSTAEVISIAAKTYIEECHKRKRHTIVYCVTRRVCHILQNVILNMLPEEEKEKIKVITGMTEEKEREQILSDFRFGKICCVINCMVLTEGVDLPICDTIINLRPTASVSLYQQIVGRATRLYKNKPYCLIIDLIPKNKNNARHLCTAPTLFGIDPFCLNEKQREKFTEKNDLLEVCDGFNHMCAEISKEMELMVEIYETFVEEREDIIKRYSIQGYKKIAKEYDHFIEEQNKEIYIDFGDLAVTIQAENEYRYKIRPTYEDEIYMSEPDMLGEVTVFFNITPVNMGAISKKNEKPWSKTTFCYKM